MKIAFTFSLLIFSIFQAWSQTLDSSFGDNGIVQTNPSIDGGQDYSIGIDILRDPVTGKLIAIGYHAPTSTSYYPMAVRYNSDGSLDTSFGDNGVSITGPVGAAWQSYLLDGALQSDGKVIGVGFGNFYDYKNGVSLPNKPIIVRFNQDGSLDDTFADDGILIPSNFSYLANCDDVLILPDGKILVSLVAKNSADNTDTVLMKLNEDGSLDTSFNGTGMVVTDLGQSETPYEMQLTPEGDKILLVGSRGINNTDVSTFMAIRYNLDGSLDNTFNGNGYAYFDLSPFPDLAFALKMQSDGKILIGGNSNKFSEGHFDVIRLMNDGSLDNSFGTDGHVHIEQAENFNTLYDIIIQADDKILLIGYNGIVGSTHPVVYRLNPDGSIDNSFGTDGLWTMNVNNDTNGDLIFSAIHDESTQSIILVGYAFSANHPSGELGTDVLMIKLTDLYELIVDIDQVKVENRITISPNPTNGYLEIQSSEAKEMNVKIYNSLGILISEHVQIQAVKSFDFSDSPADIYFIHFFMNGERIVKKFVKH